MDYLYTHLLIFCLALLKPVTSEDNPPKCTEITISSVQEKLYFNSPNYPNYFRNDTDICWVIEVTQIGNYVIGLRPTFFRLQPERDSNQGNSFLYECRGHVEIRDGCTFISPLRTRTCKKPGLIVSSTRCLYVRFTASGGLTGDKGFRFEIIPWGDAGILPSAGLEDEGNCRVLAIKSNKTNYSLMSDGYPNNYMPNSDKCYILNVKIHKNDTLNQQYSINFKILDLSLEESSGCTKDYITIRDDHSAKSNKLITRCGTEIPPNITSCGSSLHINFHSDEQMESRGFQAVYSAVLANNSECRIPDGLQSGSIVGIVCGTIIGACLLIAVMYLLVQWCCCIEEDDEDESDDEEVNYTDGHHLRTDNKLRYDL